MDESVASTGRGRFSFVHWCVALGALMACIYFLLTRLGWLDGPTGPTSSLLFLGSSTALIWGFLIGRRSERSEMVLILLSGALLVGALVSFVQNY